MSLQKGLFITIEGIEGAGKTTVMQHLKVLFDQHQLDYQLTREPGGTEIAESIRQLLLSHHDEAMVHDTELLLVFAGRAQHIARVIRPALAQNKLVLSDRFTDATYAYQGGGRGIDSARIQILEEWVQDDLRPDMTILLDVPVDIGRSRALNRSAADRIEAEQLEFFNRVRATYLERARDFQDRYRVIDVSVSIDAVQRALSDLFEREILPKVEHHE